MGRKAGRRRSCRRLHPVVLAAGLAAVSACDPGGSLPNGEAGGEASLALAAPMFVNRSSAAEALVLSVRVDGRELESAPSGDARTVEFTVSRRGSVTLDIEWSTAGGRAAAGARHLASHALATALRGLAACRPDRLRPDSRRRSRRTVQPRRARRIERPLRCRRSGRVVDSGRRLADRGRARAVDRPGRCAPRSTVHGGMLWNTAVARDTNGRALAVDRLVIDEVGAEGASPPGYRWLAMHDFESLYLYVEFEATGMHTPFRDSASYFDDDALNLFFDGDGNRSPELGAGDFHIVLPLVADAGSDAPVALAPDERAPELPPSLEYDVCVCLDRDRASGFEISVALSDIGVEIGKPYRLRGAAGSGSRRRIARGALGLVGAGGRRTRRSAGRFSAAVRHRAAARGGRSGRELAAALGKRSFRTGGHRGRLPRDVRPSRARSLS